MFRNRKVLVIGATGTIGQALVDKLLEYQPSVIRVYSRDEYKQFVLKERLGERENIRYLIGDIRDKERLNRAMNEVDIVFNLASLKHVPSCEYNPFETVKTNVMGAQNVIECAIQNRVKRVIYTSSDKAVSPTNTMGATKLLAEKLMSSAHYARGDSGTIFASVRFGNVMGSRGSVIPLFKRQILEDKCITVTEPGMTRFTMSLGQAVDLTVKACELARGGEVFVLKMPVMILEDLAGAMIENICRKENMDTGSIQVRKMGLRQGEKMHEELMSEDEAIKALETDDMYIIQSAFNEYDYPGARKAQAASYSSNHQAPIGKQEIMEMLVRERLI